MHTCALSPDLGCINPDVLHTPHSMPRSTPDTLAMSYVFTPGPIATPASSFTPCRRPRSPSPEFLRRVRARRFSSSPDHSRTPADDLDSDGLCSTHVGLDTSHHHDTGLRSGLDGQKSSLGKASRGRVKTRARGKDRGGGGGGNPRSIPKRNEKVSAAMPAWGLLGPPPLESSGRTEQNSEDEDSPAQTPPGYMANFPLLEKVIHKVLDRTEVLFVEIAATARKVLMSTDHGHHLVAHFFQSPALGLPTSLQNDSLENVARNCASILDSRSTWDFAYMIQSIHFSAKVRQ